MRIAAKFSMILAVLLMVSGCVTDNSGTTTSNNESEVRQLAAQEIVDRARTAVETISTDKDFVGIRELIAQSKGVLIFPKLVKAGFFVGGEGGVGVVMVRLADGSWGYPAFYNMVGGSIGLQVGVASTEGLFLVMTDNGLNSIIKNQFKLGADVSVALGPVGSGLGEGKTSADFASDIYGYSKETVLYGGGGFKGSVITARDDLNEAYYNGGATARAILDGGNFSNSGADALRAMMALENANSNPKSVPIVPVEQY